MRKLAVLRHEEGIRIEPERLVAIYAELGDLEADRLVARIIEEIALGIASLQRLTGAPAAGPEARQALTGAARALMRAALRLGMTSLVRVAEDVCTATGAEDWPAQAAIVARLTRIGDRSLSALWDLQEMTLTPR